MSLLIIVFFIKKQYDNVNHFNTISKGTISDNNLTFTTKV
jgi:hypothetical protein